MDCFSITNTNTKNYDLLQQATVEIEKKGNTKMSKEELKKLLQGFQISETVIEELQSMLDEVKVIDSCFNEQKQVILIENVNILSLEKKIQLLFECKNILPRIPQDIQAKFKKPIEEYGLTQLKNMRDTLQSMIDKNSDLNGNALTNADKNAIRNDLKGAISVICKVTN